MAVNVYNLQHLNARNERRLELIMQYSQMLVRPDIFGITFQGRTLSDNFVKALQPAIKDELKRLIAEVEDEMINLGFEFTDAERFKGE